MAEDKNEDGPPKGKDPAKNAGGLGGKTTGAGRRTGRPNWSQRSRGGASPLGDAPFARPQVPGPEDPAAGGTGGVGSGSAQGGGRGGTAEEGPQGHDSMRAGRSRSLSESAKGLARAGMRGARGSGAQGRGGSIKNSMKQEARSQGKRLAKKAAVKAATGAVSGATGIPQPVVEAAARHWKIALAAILIIPSLLVFSIIFIISGSYNESDSSNAACASAATLASSPTAASTTPGTPPPADQLALFLAAERWAESRNNYADASAGAIWDATYTGGTLKGSGAFGAYQYIQPTWYSYATSAGESAYAGDDPAKLPASVSDAVQDQVANWEFTRDYKQDSGNPVDTGNVWMWVAEQHFDSTYAVPADQDVAPGDNGGETMADYGNAVVGYMTTQPWINSGSSSTATTDSAQADYSGSCNATELSGPLADQIVEIASNNLGLTQFGGNTVYGPNAWGPLGEEWCAFFSSWVLDQAGITPPPGSVPNVGVLETILVSEGGTQLAPTATPQPGDLVFFGSPADPLHVAIVSQVLADGDIAVIGGNEGTNDSTTSTVDQSTPFNPADAAAEGWPHVPGKPAIWAYVQPVGV